MMTGEHYDSYPWGVGEHYLAQHSLDNIEVEVALAYRMELLWDQPVVVGGHDTSLEHLGLSSSSPAEDAFDIGGLDDRIVAAAYAAELGQDSHPFEEKVDWGVEIVLDIPFPGNYYHVHPFAS